MSLFQHGNNDRPGKQLSVHRSGGTGRQQGGAVGSAHKQFSCRATEQQQAEGQQNAESRQGWPTGGQRWPVPAESGPGRRWRPDEGRVGRSGAPGPGRCRDVVRVRAGRDRDCLLLTRPTQPLQTRVSHPDQRPLGLLDRWVMSIHKVIIYSRYRPTKHSLPLTELMTNLSSLWKVGWLCRLNKISKVKELFLIFIFEFKFVYEVCIIK